MENSHFARDMIWLSLSFFGFSADECTWLPTKSLISTTTFNSVCFEGRGKGSKLDVTGSVQFIKCLFKNCITEGTDSLGIVQITGGFSTTVDFTACNFTNCQGLGPSCVFLDYVGRSWFDSCYFSNNSNRKASGSITLDQGCVCVGEKTTISTKIFVFHCHFEDNSGGALMNYGMGLLSADSSFFIENRVSSNTTHGGSVCVGSNGEFVATNCSFLNTQSTHGRCIYCEGTNEFPFAPRLSVSKSYFDSQNVSEGSSIFVSGLSVCVLGGEFMGYSRHVFGGGSIRVRVVERLEFCNDEESALTNVNFTEGAKFVKFNTCEPSSETESEIVTETSEPTPEPTTSSSSVEPTEISSEITEETATETTEFVTETSQETETSSIETSFEPTEVTLETTEETTETENPDELSTGAIVSISITVAIVAILLIILAIVIGRKVCCKKDLPATKGDMQSLASVSLLQ